MELAQKVKTLHVIKLEPDAVLLGFLRELYRVLHVVNKDTPIFKLRVRHQVKQKATMLPVKKVSHLEGFPASRRSYQEPDSLRLLH